MRFEFFDTAITFASTKTLDIIMGLMFTLAFVLIAYIIIDYTE